MSEPTFREKLAWYAINVAPSADFPTPVQIEEAWSKAHPADPVVACTAEIQEHYGIGRSGRIENIIRKHLDNLLVTPEFKLAAIAWRNARGGCDDTEIAELGEAIGNTWPDETT